jgi:prepilin-type N-terminal cleavage/methylation domain-containing protein
VGRLGPNRSIGHKQLLKPKAFTTLELMIAMAVIAILASILFVAARALLGSTGANSTRVTLSALQGMLGELDAKTRLGRSPPMWRWSDESGGLITLTPTGGLDFWRIPYRTVIAGARGPSGTPDALDAPGIVTQDAGEFVRNGSRQIINTQLAMNFMLALPSNRAAIQKISPSVYFIPVWQSATGKTLPSPGPDGVLYTADDPGSSNDRVWYPPGAKVSFAGTDGEQRFRAKRLNQATNPPPGDTGPSGNWDLDKGPPTPILLDAWRNPIIFVPGTGLRVLLLNGQKDYQLGSSANLTEQRKQIYIVVSPEGKVKYDPTGSAAPYVTQPGRPFFASAGPDGDFTRGDDNIYSFEQ